MSGTGRPVIWKGCRPAVTIRNIECHIIDTMFAENKVKPRLPEKSTEKRVAVVIGEVPMGLA